MRIPAVWILTLGLPLASILRAEARFVQAGSTIALENGAVRIGFDRGSGELTSLENLVSRDEYLKDRAGNGGPFTLFCDFHSEFELSAAGSRFVASTDPAAISGSAIRPGNCRLAGYSPRRVLGGAALALVYRDPAGRWEANLEIKLPDAGGSSEWRLSVANLQPVASAAMVAFPDIAGFRLGREGARNLQTFLREGGAIVPAWSGGGGIYGNGGQLSMQWHALFDPGGGEYFGLIVEDDQIRNKWFRLPKPRIQVVYFPFEMLAPGAVWHSPPTRLMAGMGDWKPVARAYRGWFERAFSLVEPPQWVKRLDGWLGVWFGKKSGLHPEGNGNGLAHYLDSFAQLPEIYRERPVDMHEYAFHTEGSARVNVHTDGDNILRADLGGAAGLREGVSAAHRMGYRFTFYVEGYIVHQTSELARSGRARRWSVMHKDGSIEGPYTKQGFLHMCPGSAEWQEHLAGVTSRLLRDTGADGVRLDSLGFYHLACYNPAHRHATPFGYNRWVGQLLDRVSRAARAVNPECVLTTEAPVDFYAQWFHGALNQIYPRDVPPMRIALPVYRPFAYSQGGPLFASLAGLAGGSNGYENFRERRQADENWRSLRAGVAETLVWGDVSDENPRVSIPGVDCRLFRAPHYLAVVCARAPGGDALRLPENAVTAPARDPFSVTFQDGDSRIEGAWLYDIESAGVAPLQVNRDGGQWRFPVSKTNWFMALLRRPGGPAVASIGPVAPIRPGQSADLDLRLLSPAASRTDATVSFQGLTLPEMKVNLPAKLKVPVPAGTPPGRYPVELRGDNLVGMKRFLVIE